MYVVKNTYEKANADVLLEHMLGPIENGNAIFADPRVQEIQYYRSEDRSYAETYVMFESQESYNAWHQEHEQQHLALQEQMENYMQQMGITFQRLFPPGNGWNWADHHSEPRISPESKITFEQIFE